MDVEVQAKAARISWKWKRLFSPDTPCLTVRNTFCFEYGLPKDACRLCMGGDEVADQSIGQLNTTPATLKLSATLEDSLALYMWQSFRNGREPKDAEVWESALDSLAQKANWDALHFVSPQDLITLACLDARVNIKQDYAYKARTIEVHYDWPVATRPLLLLVRTYLLSAFAKQDLEPGACGTQTFEAVGAVLNKSPEHLSTVFSAAPPSCHLRKLRAAFLLIKLLSVISIFKPVDNHVQKGVTTLLTALGSLAVAIQLQADENSVWDSEVPEARELSLHIARLAIPVMKQLVKTDDEDCFYCCFMLQRLMSGNKPAVCHAVASELIKGGGIPVLIAVIGSASQAAVPKSRAVAVDAFHRLTSRADLPSELVDKAEELLLRLQAVPRLITFLSSLTDNFPPLVSGANGRWFDMWAVADLTNRLLMRQSEPSQPSIPLFTPTPAVWTAIQAVAEQVADISAFVERQSESFATGMDMCDFTMPADDLHPQYHYLRLRHELVKLPYNLLAVHLRNMELDVSNLMGAWLHEVLADWDPILKPDPHLQSLGQAFVQRLAKDSRILKLPENLSTIGCKINKCPGCPKCAGSIWRFKTETMAHLYVLLCSHVRERVGHSAAGVTVQALYLALSNDTEQCRHLLTGNHAFSIQTSDTLRPLLQQGFHLVIKTLRHEEAALSTQLLTAACLARLCAQDMQQGSSTPWFSTAVTKGTWDLGYDCIFSAAQAEPARPWSSLQCSALAAAMTTMADLQAGLTDQAFFTKQAAPAFEFADQLLCQLNQIARDDDHQYQLLSACVDFLAPFACFVSQSNPKIFVPEGLYNCLTDALVEYTYDTSRLGKAIGRCKARQMNPDRLGYSGLYLDNLQPRILACYMAPCKAIAPWKHFWDKAMQDLSHHLALNVEMAMNPCEGGLSRQDDRPDMKPYLAMLERYFGLGPDSFRLADGVNFPLDTPPRVVSVMVRALYHYTLLLRASQERLLAAKMIFKSALAAGHDTALLAKDLSTAEKHLAQDKKWFDVLLVSLETMRTSDIWAPIMASLSETHWYDARTHSGRVNPRQFKRLLADALTSKGQDPSCNVLSPAVVPSKGMQAQAVASRTEDSARTAYEELMEEEDQATAKAAAKKAKKLKQKAKKQQAAVDQTAEPPRSETEQEYDQFSLPHSATDAAPETSANTGAASQATSNMPSAWSAFGALHIGNVAQSSASARAVCSTDEASGVEAYHVPLHNSLGSDQSDAAVVTEQVASVQGSDSSNGSGSRQGDVIAGAQNADGDAQFLQALFCCPITKALMVEPVIAANGYTFERDALEEWLQRNSTSAVTGDLLPHTRFVPNFLIKSAISANTTC